MVKRLLPLNDVDAHLPQGILQRQAIERAYWSVGCWFAATAGGSFRWLCLGARRCRRGRLSLWRWRSRLGVLCVSCVISACLPPRWRGRHRCCRCQSTTAAIVHAHGSAIYCFSYHRWKFLFRGTSSHRLLFMSRRFYSDHVIQGSVAWWIFPILPSKLYTLIARSCHAMIRL